MVWRLEGKEGLSWMKGGLKCVWVGFVIFGGFIRFVLENHRVGGVLLDKV